ncbi:protein RAFTIN 1B-like [Lolium rigidum]|uniref:protein RAFTIN 1B-like n=1 Tax=Lolium rigidum TaxID=89674 RepID=UPI001F5DD4B2|nr:protein RAFTIN 1B-like [Lolium rigidum]
MAASVQSGRQLGHSAPDSPSKNQADNLSYYSPSKNQADNFFRYYSTSEKQAGNFFRYYSPSENQADNFFRYYSPSKYEADNLRYYSPSENQTDHLFYSPIKNQADMFFSYHSPPTTVFFHERRLWRVGERLPFPNPLFYTVLGFLPRRVADSSVPFSTPALPGILAAFRVAPGYAMASNMEATLRSCETPTMAGESKFCATSLEALEERVTGVPGTRDVRPLKSALPRDGAPLQAYTVRAVRRVEGGLVFVACHPVPFMYTVYRCHTTGPSRAYMVEMEGAHGAADGVTIATVCQTDTSMWNPKHISFRLLGTKPGGTPVCHLMPYGHIIWAKGQVAIKKRTLQACSLYRDDAVSDRVFTDSRFDKMTMAQIPRTV